MPQHAASRAFGRKQPPGRAQPAGEPGGARRALTLRLWGGSRANAVTWVSRQSRVGTAEPLRQALTRHTSRRRVQDDASQEAHPRCRVGKLGCEQLLLDKHSVRQNLQKDIFVHGSQNSERHAAPLSGRVQSCVGGTVYRRLPSPPLPYLPTAPTHLPKDSSLICFHCFPFSPTAPPSASLPAPSCLRRGTVID